MDGRVWCITFYSRTHPTGKTIGMPLLMGFASALGMLALVVSIRSHSFHNLYDGNMRNLASNLRKILT